MMLNFLVAVLTALLLAGPAQAGPVFVAALSAGAGVGSAFAATALGGFLSTTVGRILLSVAFSALQAALQEKPKPPGIVTETTLTGSTQPLSFTLGLYATGGQMAAPPMSHGSVDGVPNAYRTYVITLGAVPGTKLSRLMLNGEYVELGATAHADYGLPVLGRYTGYAWIKYYDGSQTVADPMLRAKYGADPDRPWTADMVGTGLCYAILTFRYSQTVWTSGEPGWRFELKDTPLYDPRKDSSVGGSGTHRWNDRATWEGSNNPIVQAYNIMRGIEIPGLGIWGGEMSAVDLPLSDWFAAMNICDQTVTRPGGAAETRYRTGYEIKVDVEPASVLEELFKASATRIAEIGGIWKPRTGGPGLPVWFMTDDDIIVTSPQELDPFPGADQRYNGISTNGPHPDAVWEAEPDPELYNATWEGEDGGKRRMASLDLPACPYPVQRQRVARAYIKDERRFRRHQLTLPPDAAVLEPLDTLGWTSAYNGYVTKHFEIGDMQDDIVSILQTVSMREVDPTDYADPPEYGEIVTPVPTTRRPIPAQVLAGFNALPGTTVDAGGNPRRPHIRLVWAGSNLDGVTGIDWEVRLLAGAVAVSSGSIADVETGVKRVFEGIVNGTQYQARARQIAPWPVAWTDWVTVQSDNSGLIGDDMSAAFLADIATTAELAGVKPVSVLPATGSKVDQIVCLIPPGRLYRWTGTAWTQNLFAGVEAGSLDNAAFAANIRPVEIVTALPTSANFAGRTVYLTADGKLYRHTGSPAGSAGFTAAVPAADVTGQLTDDQIADVAAAKLTGQITGPQIEDGAISDAKIAGLAAAKLTGQITNAQIADLAAAKLTGQITETQVTDSAISAPKLAAGAVTTAKLAAGAVTTENLSVGSSNNTISNSQFLGGLYGWRAGAGADGNTGVLSIRTSGTYTKPGVPVLQVYQPDGGTAGYVDVRQFVVGSGNYFGSPVRSGSSWEASIYVSAVRCRVELRIEWRTAFGSTISYAPVVYSSVDAGSGTDPDLWPRLVTRGVAPANTAFGVIHIRKCATFSGEADSYMFVHKPLLGETVPNASEAMEWSPGGWSLITGDAIMTGSVQANRIEANSLTAAQIATGAITADELAANSVVAGKVAAGAITAVAIDAGAVTTAKLAAGAVIADTIAAGAVTTAKIATGAVTANEVAANAVTADKVAANAITTGKIAAGAVAANQIAAQAVVASKLAIGDTSNIFPDPLLVDFPNGWTFTGPSFYNAGVTTVQAATLAFSPSRNELLLDVAGVDATGGLNSPVFSVEAGAAYYASICMGARNSGLTANCTTRLYVRWYSDPDGSTLITSSLVAETTATYATSTAPISGIVTAPSDARSARLYAQRIGDATTDAYTFSGPVVRRANAGELTVDGSIRANHLAVEELITDSAQIRALIVNSAHLATASVTNAKIANLAVDTAQLALAAVDTANIKNLAVTGAKIEDLTVGTIKITDNAITNGVGANKTSLTSSGMTTSSRDVTISCIAGSKVCIIARATGQVLAGATTTCVLRIKWNGAVIATYTGEMELILDDMIFVTAVAGTNTLRFEYVSNTGYAWTRTFGPALLLELKK